jgi:topoisomerase-4 subunit A
MPGPDFPTGGVLVEDPAAIAAAYETGRGGFRVRATWAEEQGKHGTWAIVVTEIPYQVQKSRLIEQIAQLLEEKKLPLLGDVRDESTEAVRLVLEPKSKNIDAATLMESLFRATALEQRFPLNMNVLAADRTPRVMGLREVLRHWLDHRQEVLVRRTRHRLAAIEKRLEILAGFLAVFLNLDEVIRIIRNEDEPKPALIAAFTINDAQAEAILNMRLRSLRRLEEIEIRKEHDALSKERAQMQTLLGDEKLRWKRIVTELEETKKKFGAGPLGTRRTRISGAPPAITVSDEAFIEREAITVILSEKGWVRAARGVRADASDQKFKEGDGPRLLLPCETTDRLCLFASNGRAYTLRANDLPRGRNDWQPLRLLADLANEDSVLSLFVPREGERFLVVSASGRGFVVKAEDLAAEKRTGKQVLNLREGESAVLCVPAEGDQVAIVGTNRKLLIFPLDQVPELARGTGVQLQRYKDATVADAKVFRLKDGLTWKSGDRTRTETNLRDWRGERADAGRLPPSGFPRSNKFG